MKCFSSLLDFGRVQNMHSSDLSWVMYSMRQGAQMRSIKYHLTIGLVRNHTTQRVSYLEKFAEIILGSFPSYCERLRQNAHDHIQEDAGCRG